MRSATKITSIVAAVGAGALGLGLVGFGTGVGANFVDSVTGTANAQVGTFSCELFNTSSNPNVHISADRKTATVSLPEIDSSTANSDTAPVYVKNTGTIPLVVNWTVTASNTSAPGLFASGAVSPVMPTQNLQINKGASRHYDMGVKWTTLGNADLGQAGSVTYKADCTEPSAAGHSGITLEGNQGGTAAWSSGNVDLTIPSGVPQAAGANIMVNEFPPALPSSEPKFIASPQSGGTPRWVIKLTSGVKLVGPVPSGGAMTWYTLTPPGFGVAQSGITWNDIYNEYQGSTVTQAVIVMDTSANTNDGAHPFTTTNGVTSTVSCINYPGDGSDVNFGSC